MDRRRAGHGGSHTSKFADSEECQCIAIAGATPRLGVRNRTDRGRQCPRLRVAATIQSSSPSLVPALSGVSGASASAAPLPPPRRLEVTGGLALTASGTSSGTQAALQPEGALPLQWTSGRLRGADWHLPTAHVDSDSGSTRRVSAYAWDRGSAAVAAAATVPPIRTPAEPVSGRCSESPPSSWPHAAPPRA